MRLFCGSPNQNFSQMFPLLLASAVFSAFISTNPSAFLNELCATKNRSTFCELQAKCPSSSPICDVKNVLAVLNQMCATDFKSNPNCAAVTSFCTANTATCASSDPISSIPTASEASNEIFSICYEMPQMSACSICPPPDRNTKISDCPLLQTYADHCTEMPDMFQCQKFTAFCSSLGKDSTFCGGPGSNPGTIGSAPSKPTKYCGPNDSWCITGVRETTGSTCFTVHSKATGWFGFGIGSQMTGDL